MRVSLPHAALAGVVVALAFAIPVAGGGLPPGCAPVSRDVPFVFPRDYGVHVNAQWEWWWFLGHLQTLPGVSPVRHFGVLLASTRVAESCTSIADSVFTTAFTIADVANNTYLCQELWDLGLFMSASSGNSSLVLRAGQWSVVQSPLDLSLFVLVAKDSTKAVYLDMVNVLGPQLMGRDGFDGPPPPAPPPGYHHNVPLFETSGLVIVGDEEFNVSGQMYLQHIYGVQLPGPPPPTGRYDWLTAQLDNGWVVGVFAGAPHGNYSADPWSFANAVNCPGSRPGVAAYFGRDEWTLSRSAPWVSPEGEVWELNHTFVLPSLKLVINWWPYVSDNVVDTGVNYTYYDGVSHISAEVDSRPVGGTGWTALNHHLI